LGYSLFALSDWILGLAVALGFIGLRALTIDSPPLSQSLAKPVRYFANMSFSLYLLHWPVIKLLVILGWPYSRSLLLLAAAMIVIMLACAGFASLVEHRRHAIRAFLERTFVGRRASAEAIGSTA
jgi:peptidoglycan/LPS O-acetylase OafA/YrhL